VVESNPVADRDAVEGVTMPVELARIRDLLLPGLWAIQGEYRALPAQWAQIFAPPPQAEVLPIVLSPATVLATAAAAAILRNPIVTRRFWKWWS